MTFLSSLDDIIYQELETTFIWFHVFSVIVSIVTQLYGLEVLLLYKWYIIVENVRPFVKWHSNVSAE